MSDMLLSFRIEKTKSTTGQAEHDFFKRPLNADPEKFHLNKSIYGGSFADVQATIKSQKRSIIKKYNEIVENKRKEVLPDVLPLKKSELSSSQKLQKLGSWRKDTSTHKMAVITFNREFSRRQDDINKDDLDACASSFFEDFCKKNNCELAYLVRHDDETTTHYHATYTNVDMNTSQPHRFQKKHTSGFQDLAGEHFGKMGIHRGIKRGDRLEIARLNNPIHENESESDYEKRVYRIANVAHRNVKQLNDDLLKEVAEKEAVIAGQAKQILDQAEQLAAQKVLFDTRQLDLEAIISDGESKLLKINKNISTAQNKLELSIDKDSLITNKIEKNIRTYERRQGDWEAKVTAARNELSNISELVESEQKELKELKKTDIPRDIAVTYEVVTSKSVLKNETKIMSLVEPSRYKKLVKQLNLKEKLENKKERLNNQKEQRLVKLEQTLNRDKSKFDELVQERVNKHISDSALDIKERVTDKAKLLLKDFFIENVPYQDQIKMSDKDIEKFESLVNKNAQDEVDSLLP